MYPAAIAATRMAITRTLALMLDSSLDVSETIAQYALLAYHGKEWPVQSVVGLSMMALECDKCNTLTRARRHGIAGVEEC